MVNILIDVQEGLERFSAVQETVFGAINHALERTGAPAKAQIGLLIVGEEAMREMNREHRGIDRPTDVLSFPLLEPGQEITQVDMDPETGEVMLGDIVISLPASESQALEYGHSLARETAFLAVHGTLHLMGFDHESEPDRLRMREMEEAVLGGIGLARLEGGHMTEKEMVEGARGARLNAYAPYSNFRVGACLKAKSGKLYYGCNVESVTFTPTCCAERTALFTAVAAGEREFEAIAVASDGRKPPWPCGVCRQALMEFSPDMVVIAAAESGGWEMAKLTELLPHAFTDFKDSEEHNG